MTAGTEIKKKLLAQVGFPKKQNLGCTVLIK